MHMLKRVPVAIWVGLATICLVALVAGLGRAAVPRHSRLSGKSLTAVRELVQTAAQFSRQAGQDVDARQRARDVDMGLAYIAAARYLAPDDVITARSGIKVGDLFATLKAQDVP